MKIINSFLLSSHPFHFSMGCLSCLFHLRCVHPYPSTSLRFWGHAPPNQMWGCNCCLCGRISAGIFHVCPEEFQLQNPPVSRMLLCTAGLKGKVAAPTWQLIDSVLLFGSVLNLPSLEGETCLFKFTEIIFTEDFQKCVLHCNTRSIWALTLI